MGGSSPPPLIVSRGSVARSGPLSSVFSIKSINPDVMTLLKFSAIVTEGSGSLGGHTIQHSKGGMQLRTKPIPRGQPSASQTLIRSINPLLQAGWRALTDTQRKIWNDWPATHGIMNAHGDKHTLSGHSLWMKYQFSQLINGYPFLPFPHYFNQGPNLFSNWENSPIYPFETFITNANSVDSAINTLEFGIAGFFCPLNILVGDSYILYVDHHLLSGSLYGIALKDHLATNDISNIVHPIEGISSYIFTVTSSHLSFYFQFATLVPASFYLKNVILKKILT